MLLVLFCHVAIRWDPPVGQREDNSKETASGGEAANRGLQWNQLWIDVKNLFCQVLEDSGTITLTCSFTYDHDLHESLRLAWIFDSGSGPYKRIGPRESGRVTMRSSVSQISPSIKRPILQGCSGQGGFFDVSISTSLNYVSYPNHQRSWTPGWWVVQVCCLNKDGQG